MASIYQRPIAFAVTAAVVVLVGTLVTVIIPLFMPSTQPVKEYVKPYTAIELEGRDIYIREGCNNCHTQTVRPIRTEVARYGDYSKPEEFAYDRPFLWGSKRTGPDLARIGGKYPDAWHYKHMNDPRSMFAKSNMPAYGWLAKRPLDTSLSYKKTKVLGYGYTEEEVRRQIEEYRRKVTSPDYPAKKIRDQITPPELRDRLTEMDAIVAYLQKIGRDYKETQKGVVQAAAVETFEEMKNPYEGMPEAIEQGREIFQEKCSACHGPDAKGSIGPNLTDDEWKYGWSDREVFISISNGRPNGMPAWGQILSEDDIWKVIAYIRSLKI